MMHRKLIAAAVAAAVCGVAGGAAAQAQTSQATTANVARAATTTNYSASMQRLLDAAQRLRESIQAMAQQPAGGGRNQAIAAAHEALMDAQYAMMLLPPDLREGAGLEGTNETEAFERLRQAADQLRQSIQAMAQQPAGERRNAAARQANEALIETQIAMVSLPPELRTAQATAAGKSSANRAGAGAAASADSASRYTPMVSGGRAGAQGADTAPTKAGDRAASGEAVASRETVRDRVTFESLDRDNDGYISMLEAAIDADSVNMFKARDGNHDYRVSRAEWMAGVDRGIEGANEAQTPR